MKESLFVRGIKRLLDDMAQAGPIQGEPAELLGAEAIDEIECVAAALGAHFELTAQGWVPKVRGSKAKPISGAAWGAYSKAYYDRYGVDPVRNATVNAQMARFVSRVGQTEAPHIAAYFLMHNGRWYVEKAHSVACLLVDAEKLRTEWATQRQVTHAKAREIDAGQKKLTMWQEVEDDLGSL